MSDDDKMDLSEDSEKSWGEIYKETLQSARLQFMLKTEKGYAEASNLYFLCAKTQGKIFDTLESKSQKIKSKRNIVRNLNKTLQCYGLQISFISIRLGGSKVGNLANQENNPVYANHEEIAPILLQGEEILKKVLEVEENPQSYIYASNMHRNSRNYKQSIQYIHSAMSIDPFDAKYAQVKRKIFEHRDGKEVGDIGRSNDLDHDYNYSERGHSNRGPPLPPSKSKYDRDMEEAINRSMRTYDEEHDPEFQKVIELSLQMSGTNTTTNSNSSGVKDDDLQRAIALSLQQNKNDDLEMQKALEASILQSQSKDEEFIPVNIERGQFVMKDLPTKKATAFLDEDDEDMMDEEDEDDIIE